MVQQKVALLVGAPYFPLAQEFWGISTTCNKKMDLGSSVSATFFRRTYHFRKVSVVP
jgi:hypothetical protein